MDHPQDADATVEHIENELDKILICMEEYLYDSLNFISWNYNVIPLKDRGADVYRVIITGAVKSRIFTYDFIAVAYVAIPNEGTVSCIEMEVFISNGKRLSLRPEVEMDKCLRRFCRSY